MKSSGNSWLTTIIVFVVGVLLIVWHSRIDILNWLVILVGAMLVIPAIYSFIAALMRKRKAGEDEKGVGPGAPNSTIWTSVAAAALGLWMIFSPDFFVGLIAYIFGAILVLYGIYHIVTISVWSRPYILPFWFYIIPILMILAGIVLLCTSVRTMNSVVVLITGIALVASSLNTVLETVAVNPTRRQESDRESGKQITE